MSNSKISFNWQWFQHLDLILDLAVASHQQKSEWAKKCEFCVCIKLVWQTKPWFIFGFRWKNLKKKVRFILWFHQMRSTLADNEFVWNEFSLRKLNQNDEN